MWRRSANKPIRRVAAALSTALFSVAVVSCTSLLGIDDYHDATAELCSLLATCFAGGVTQGCAAQVVEPVRATDTDTREAWLTLVADEHCLESCSQARGCLDAPPVCKTAACAARDDCCDALTGLADCSPAGQCCKPTGVPCSVDDDCCEAHKGACDARSKTCGGVVCRLAGAECELDKQCCTRSCDLETHSCAQRTCSPDGYACGTATDCCTHACNGGFCGEPTCTPDDLPCATDGDCCVKHCNNGYCTTETCRPRNAECATDVDCCSGHCDTTFFVCGDPCQADAEACSVNGDCCHGNCDGGTCVAQCGNGYCSTGDDCCSGTCLGGTCSPDCGTATCDHDVCTTGGPLAPTCDDGSTGCLMTVCDADPFCCCGGWDSKCLSEIGKCGACG